MMRFLLLAAAGLTLGACGSLDRATNNSAAVIPYNAFPQQRAASTAKRLPETSVAMIQASTWASWRNGAS